MTPFHNLTESALKSLVLLTEYPEYKVLILTLEYLKNDILNGVLVPGTSESDLARLNQARGFNVALTVLNQLADTAKHILETKTNSDVPNPGKNFPHPSSFVQPTSKVTEFPKKEFQKKV
jgi:hypothetical protein